MQLASRSDVNQVQAGQQNFEFYCWSGPKYGKIPDVILGVQSLFFKEGLRAVSAEGNGWTDISDLVTGANISGSISGNGFQAEINGRNYDSRYITNDKCFILQIRTYPVFNDSSFIVGRSQIGSGIIGGNQTNTLGWSNYYDFYVGYIEKGSVRVNRNNNSWTCTIKGPSQYLGRSILNAHDFGLVDIASGKSVTTSSDLIDVSDEAGSTGEYISSTDTSGSKTVDGNMDTLWISNEIPLATELRYGNSFGYPRFTRIYPGRDSPAWKELPQWLEIGMFNNIVMLNDNTVLGDFENSTSINHWQTFWANKARVTTPTPQYGTYCLKIETNAVSSTPRAGLPRGVQYLTNYATGGVMTRAATVDKDYTYSLWIRGDSGGEKIIIQWGNGETKEEDSVTLSTKWQKYTHQATCANAQMHIQVKQDNDAGNASIAFYIDEVRISESLNLKKVKDTDTTRYTDDSLKLYWSGWGRYGTIDFEDLGTDKLAGDETLVICDDEQLFKKFFSTDNINLIQLRQFDKDFCIDKRYGVFKLFKYIIDGNGAIRPDVDPIVYDEIRFRSDDVTDLEIDRTYSGSNVWHMQYSNINCAPEGYQNVVYATKSAGVMVWKIPIHNASSLTFYVHYMNYLDLDGYTNYLDYSYDTTNWTNVVSNTNTPINAWFSYTLSGLNRDFVYFRFRTLTSSYLIGIQDIRIKTIDKLASTLVPMPGIYEAIERQNPYGTGEWTIQPNPMPGDKTPNESQWLRIDLGTITPYTLQATINSAATALALDTTQDLPDAGSGQLDREVMTWYVNDKTNNILSSIQRGAAYTTADTHTGGSLFYPVVNYAKQLLNYVSAIEWRRKQGKPYPVKYTLLGSTRDDPQDPSQGTRKWEANPDWFLLAQVDNNTASSRYHLLDWDSNQSIKPVSVNSLTPNEKSDIYKNAGIPLRHVCMVIHQMSDKGRAKINEFKVYKSSMDSGAWGNWRGHAPSDLIGVWTHILYIHFILANSILYYTNQTSDRFGMAVPYNHMQIAESTYLSVMQKLCEETQTVYFEDQLNNQVVHANPFYHTLYLPEITFTWTESSCFDINPTFEPSNKVSQVKVEARNDDTGETFVASYPKMPNKVGEKVIIHDRILLSSQEAESLAKSHYLKENHGWGLTIKTGLCPWVRLMQRHLINIDFDSGGSLFNGKNFIVTSINWDIKAGGDKRWTTTIGLEELMVQ